MSIRLLFVILIVAIGFDCRTDSEAKVNIPPELLNDQLAREFNESFPIHANPNGVIRKFEFRAAEFESGIRPPYRARVWGYNRQVPGPVIRIQLGDTLEVQLINDLPQPTTIHWHGVRVPNAMDGVPEITQKPVGSGENFTYRFTPKDAGTFWFHSHFNSAEQIEKGLHGVLIIEDPDEPQYSRELVWILDDWLLEPDGTIYNEFVTRHDLAHDGRWGNFLTINGKSEPSFQVKAGERVRVRIINVANGRVFSPAISGLDPLVIAVDGMRVAKPKPLQDLLLAPGNRIDLDLLISKQAAGSRLQIVDNFSREVAVLRIVAVDPDGIIDSPRFDPPRADRFPDWSQAEQAPIDHEFILDAEPGGPYGIAWTIDGQTWPKSEAT